VRRRHLLGLLCLAPLIRPAAGGEVELVMFELASCPYCQRWHREIGPIYPKTTEGRRAPLRRVDLQAPRPPDLAGIENILYTPTFVLTQGGREVGRITGYPGEDFFWPMLDDLMSRLHRWPGTDDHIRT
jgi:hypothetical protein